jgi:nicotinamidase-related amidase
MPADTALLILDAQVNMFDAALYDGAALLERLRTLLDRARTARIPVVFVQNSGGPGDPDEPGTAGWALHPALPVEPADLVIEKRNPDAFEGTSLQQELATRGIRTLVIAGMQTELCIDATCRRAAALGYDVTLVADSHSTFDGSSLRAADIIAQQNAQLGTLATLQQARDVTFGTR